MRNLLAAEYDALAIAITDQGWSMNAPRITRFLSRAEEHGAPGHLVQMCREVTVPVVVKERALALVARRAADRRRAGQKELAFTP